MKKGEYKHTEESRAKMSAAHKGRKQGPHSEETKEKIRQKALGRIPGPETRARMSEAHKNPSPETRAKWRVAATGRVPTAETRAKISSRRKGISRPASEETKRKMSLVRKGIPKTEATKAKMRAAQASPTPEARKNRREATSRSNKERQLTGYDFNVKGYFISKKAKGSPIPFRSVNLELRLMELFDADINVRVWRSPFSVSYQGLDGATMWALPDFLVTYQDGAQRIIEGKGAHLLSDYLAGQKFKAVFEWCLQNDVDFDIVVFVRKDKPFTIIEVIKCGIVNQDLLGACQALGVSPS